MLAVEDIHTYHGSSHILHGVSLELRAGEVVTLMGRNGMGKTTTMRSIMALTPPRRGRVLLDGVDMAGARPHTMARAGLGYVPEDRQVFRALSVEENLLIAQPRAGMPPNNKLPDAWTLERVYGLFPRLAERRRHWG
ncbi:MAG: ATP-binding cassette domain-containing protein, partial [Deltaproteobacteria bacterium]|nr:ATP-binding cassette domain-containing protein [Deltaproteobacteria bacterium]